MKPWIALILGGPVLLLALAGTFCRGSRAPEPAARKDGPVKAGPVKIAQFYASTPVVERGEQALLCYGVENARAVRIVPEVEPVRPAYSRCIPVTPQTSTTYTLTAEGEDGSTATATLVLKVAGVAKPKRAPEQTQQAAGRSSAGPLIAAFRTEKKADITLLCYEVEGAEAVAIEPQVLPRSGALRGCLGVAPKAPTTYTLIAYGPGGKTARRALEVAP